MNKIVRVIFFSGALACWIGVFILGLETYARIKWQWVEWRNPFLLARRNQTPWPVSEYQSNEFSSYLTDATIREKYRGKGKTLEALPPASKEHNVDFRVAFFKSLDEAQRFSYAGLHNQNILLCDKQGRILKSYSETNYDGTKTLADWLNAEDAAAVLHAIRNELPDNTSSIMVSGVFSQNKTCYQIAPEKDKEIPKDTDPGFWLFYSKAPDESSLSPDTLWDIPFVIYKKHAVRTQHISVLGLNEEYYINNFGFRDADIIVPKPPGVFRILCIGASTTEEGLTNNLTYPAIVETIMNRHFDFNAVHVVNCGISGMNSPKHLLRLPDYLELEPDMIVFYIATNDICHLLLPYWMDHAVSSKKCLIKSRYMVHYFNHLLFPSDEQLTHYIEDNFMNALRTFIDKASAEEVETVLCSFAAPDVNSLSRKEYEYFNFQTMREWGGHYVTFDSYLRILTLYNIAMKRLAKEKNIPYIPVAENLHGGASLFGDICHLRSPGIEKKAEIIAQSLLSLLRSSDVFSNNRGVQKALEP